MGARFGVFGPHRGRQVCPLQQSRKRRDRAARLFGESRHDRRRCGEVAHGPDGAGGAGESRGSHAWQGCALARPRHAVRRIQRSPQSALNRASGTVQVAVARLFRRRRRTLLLRRLRGKRGVERGYSRLGGAQHSRHGLDGKRNRFREKNSRHAKITIAADWSENLSLYSAFPKVDAATFPTTTLPLPRGRTNTMSQSS